MKLQFITFLYSLTFMLSLIVSLNRPQAEFIQKGLAYEHFSVVFYSIHQREELKNTLYLYDSVLIVLQDSANITEAMVREWCEFFRKNKPNVVIAVLNYGLYPFLDIFKQEGLIQHVFRRPFSFRHIAAEIRFSIFEAKDSLNENVYVLRDLELDVSRHSVKYKNKVIKLRHKEFELLHFLMRNKGKVLNRLTILENVWDQNANAFTNTVDVHISQLRKKLNSEEDKYIHTVPCTGYFLA